MNGIERGMVFKRRRVPGAVWLVHSMQTHLTWSLEFASMLAQYVEQSERQEPAGIQKLEFVKLDDRTRFSKLSRLVWISSAAEQRPTKERRRVAITIF